MWSFASLLPQFTKNPGGYAPLATENAPGEPSYSEPKIHRKWIYALSGLCLMCATLNFALSIASIFRLENRIPSLDILTGKP